MFFITWVLSTKVQVHLFVFQLVLWCRNRVWPAASKRWSSFYKNRSHERVLAVLFKILQVAHISDVSKPNRTVHIYRGGWSSGRPLLRAQPILICAVWETVWQVRCKPEPLGNGGRVLCWNMDASKVIQNSPGQGSGCANAVKVLLRCSGLVRM